ncbi:MAG: hypothetical protein HXS46_11480 [Theionarchaea archaeon]|nr:hypothetical protein [Theionarchaea archaeon]
MKSRKVIFVLVLMLSLSIPTTFSANNNFSVDYTFEPVMGGCGEFLVADTQIQAIPGEPLTPYRACAILLPQDVVVKDVKVKTSAPVIQKGFDIPWGQPPCTFSDEPVMVGRNEAIYSSDNDYPGKLFEVVSVESFRGFQILNVILYPVQYKPKSQTVKFYENMTVEVKFGKGLKNKLYRGLTGDKKAVSGMVDNPEVAGTYEDGPQPLQTEEYIIITNSTMQSTFQQLADWKANFVNGAGVYTVSWIYSNYTGVDNAEKVRNFIKDWYTNHGTKWVLMGGDIAAVPYRGFYIYAGGYTDYDMLADMYFRCLDGTFNDDGDSRWAEPNDGVDWYPEVAVGRASCETVVEAQNFVNKVIAYEQADKPKRALLHQSRVMSGNYPDSRCLAWNCDDWLPPDYYCDYVFEEDPGGVPKSRWISQWAANPCVVAHIGHGSTTAYYINYQKDIGTVTWYNSDVATLTNTFWPWTTSVACHSGEIEYNDCLAETYVKDPDNGAIAVIYNDNYGWFMTNDACALSGEFCEMEFKACWNDGYEKFGDLLNQALSYMIPSAQTDPYYRWCFYERNLVGDPESPCLTVREEQQASITITYPPDGAVVSGTVLITTETYGIDTVEFYIDGVLKYTDTSEPFEWAWDTTQYANGLHTILVKGYASGVFKDDDQVTVTVSNLLPPQVIIINPKDGETVSGMVKIRVIVGLTDSEISARPRIDTVEFYIDNRLVYTDTAAPFIYEWDTTRYRDGPHTILVKGYYRGVFMDDDQITVRVDNTTPYIEITNPEDGATVFGTVLVSTDTRNIDMVVFYLNGEPEYESTSEPFQWKWDTKQYENGDYELTAEGYQGDEPVIKDSIKVRVRNPTEYSLGLFSLLLVFLIPAKIRKR